MKEARYNWDAMTVDERDALVATKVMDWQPKECDGEIGELPIAPDGWFCQKCGYNRSWGTTFKHQELPPDYSTSMDAAWLVIRRFYDQVGIPFDKAWMQADTFYRALLRPHLHRPREEFRITLADLVKWTPEKICKAALIAVGCAIE